MSISNLGDNCCTDPKLHLKLEYIFWKCARKPFFYQWRGVGVIHQQEKYRIVVHLLWAKEFLEKYNHKKMSQREQTQPRRGGVPH